MDFPSSSPQFSPFVSVPLNQFLAGLTTPVDVFVLLPDGKHVQVLKAGEVIPEDRIKQYEARDVRSLWVRREDLTQLTEQTLSIAGVVIEQSRASLSTKSVFLAKAATALFRDFDTLGLNQPALNSAKQIASSVLTLVRSEHSWLKLMEELNRVDEDLLRHSLAVGVMAPMIAEAMGWHRKDTLEKLALGGLLHDIGLKELDPEIMKTSRAELRFEQVRDYEGHTLRGAQILALVSKIPEEIISIVVQHHENAFGLGFPKRLRDIKMHPFAKVVALADAFCEVILVSPWNPVPKSPERALRWIEDGLSQPFNREAFKALNALVRTSKLSRTAFDGKRGGGESAA
jgi:putative nucleotidyltransferase with HDIG domain